MRIRHGWSGRLGLEEGVVALGLLEAHGGEAGHDKEPIEVVRDDGAVGGRVLPAENGVEDAPAAVVGGGR